jgi:hypothetical protein
MLTSRNRLYDELTHKNTIYRSLLVVLALFVLSWFVLASGVLHVIPHSNKPNTPHWISSSLISNNNNNGQQQQQQQQPLPITDHNIQPIQQSTTNNLQPLPPGSNGNNNNLATTTTTTNLSPSSIITLPIQNNKKYPVRLYCAIPAVYNQHGAVSKWQTILDLWGWRCDILKFFIHPYNLTRKSDKPHPPFLIHAPTGMKAEVVLLTDFVRTGKTLCYTMNKNADGSKNYEPCKHIWEKVWRMWVWTAKHQIIERTADYFFKIDDDTYFIPENMRQSLRDKNWDPDTERHYFGYRGFPISKSQPIVAGACVGFTYATLMAIAPVYESMEHEYGDRSKFKHGRCVDRDGATEEVTTSRCLRSIGIVAEDLRDEYNRMKILPWMAKDVLSYRRKKNSTSWFYRDQPDDIPTEENCCSDEPVAFHYMKDAHELSRLHDLFYDPNNKRELDRIVAEEVPKWLDPSYRGIAGVIHYGIPANVAKEAQYFLRVKKKLPPMSRDPPP